MRYLVGALLLTLPLAQGAAAFESWIERRDEQLIRQQRDFSCGLAALATILSYSFDDAVTEDELLRQLTRLERAGHRLGPGLGPGPRISFATLAALARERGYRARGYALPRDNLGAFKVPVIVSLRAGGRDHFSVLKGTLANGSVWLADPSWGNRRLSALRFERMFVRYPGTPQANTSAQKTGRALLIVPSRSASRPVPVASPVQSLPMPVHLEPALP